MASREYRMWLEEVELSALRALDQAHDALRLKPDEGELVGMIAKLEEVVATAKELRERTTVEIAPGPRPVPRRGVGCERCHEGMIFEGKRSKHCPRCLDAAMQAMIAREGL